MRRPGRFVVAYDISDDAERVRVERVLPGFGYRVQKSVFECELRMREYRQLLARLGEYVPTNGSVMIRRLQANAKRVVVGEAPPPPDTAAVFIV